MVHPDNGILFNTKKKCALKPGKDMEEHKIHWTKKSIWKVYIVYDSNYMTFWRRQKYRDGKKINSCQGERGGMNG